jgi:hypothetical protein
MMEERAKLRMLLNWWLESNKLKNDELWAEQLTLTLLL